MVRILLLPHIYFFLFYQFYEDTSKKYRIMLGFPPKNCKTVNKIPKSFRYFLTHSSKIFSKFVMQIYEQNTWKIRLKKLQIQENPEWYYHLNVALIYIKVCSFTNLVRVHFCEPNIVRTFPWKKISSVTDMLYHSDRSQIVCIYNYLWYSKGCSTL